LKVNAFDAAVKRLIGFGGKCDDLSQLGESSALDAYRAKRDVAVIVLIVVPEVGDDDDAISLISTRRSRRQICRFHVFLLEKKWESAVALPECFGVNHDCHVVNGKSYCCLNSAAKALRACFCVCAAAPGAVRCRTPARIAAIPLAVGLAWDVC